MIDLQDQNATVYLYTRDKLGRVTADVANVLGMIIDALVRAICSAYDDAGRLFTNTSYSHIAPNTRIETGTRSLRDHPQRVNQSGDVEHQRQNDVQDQRPADAFLEANSQRRQQNGDDDQQHFVHGVTLQFPPLA